MLCDSLVCGITDTTVQKRLLAEKDLTLDKAISLPQSVEVAEKGTIRTFKPPQEPLQNYTKLAMELLPAVKTNQKRPRTRAILTEQL